MRLIAYFFAVFGLVLPIASAGAEFPYLDTELSAEKRVEDLLTRMTLEEKVGQMCQFVGIKHIQESENYMSLEAMQGSDAHGIYSGLHSSQIPPLIEKGEIGSFLHVMTPAEANQLQRHAAKTRLGIPLIIGIDAIHGNGMVNGATIYPASLGMASSWNLDLVRKSSAETALEMRANGSHWAFTPNVDVARDPRWGRAGETFGEDPYLTGEMGAAAIEGLQQGDFTGYKKVIANAKHLVAGGDPANGLNASPMDVSERTLREVYFPPFQRAIDAGVFSFMAAHNEVNGVPSHGSEWLLSDVLRGEWGFDGFVVSDWMDIERMVTLHKVAENQKEAVFLAVRAGIDMHMHGPDFLEPLVELVKEGRISEERIDASVRPILLAKFKLGLFENPYVDEAAAKTTNFNEAHQQTALESARQAIVLLTNNILPLKGDEKVFITGPNANNHSLMGDWALKQPEANITTVVEGFREYLGNDKQVQFYDVGDQVRDVTDKQVRKAGKLAKKADVAVVVVGENPLRYDIKGKTSGENVARANINLIGKQLDLIKSVHASGTPTIVIFINGRPLAEPWVAENADAFIEAWEPGAKGGLALAEIVFGKVNPSGKLPMTIPYSVGHITAYYNAKPTAYTRRYTDAPTRNLFEFGYGLSYTRYSYGEPSISKREIARDGTTRVSIEVKNTGKRAGAEVVQMYIRDDVSQVTRPVKELKGFERIELDAGESKVVTFNITPDMLAFYDLDMKKIVEPGSFTVMVGSSSRDQDLKTTKLIVK